jgi:hypothetical protein
MTALSVLLGAALLAAAALHLLWAIGFWWPIRDEAALARAVVGVRGIKRMPGAAACSAVVVALLFAAMWARTLVRVDHWLVTAVGLALAAVFLGRGAATYAGLIRRLAPEEPFAALDRRWYAPLCLAFGAGFLILSLGG